MRLQVTFSDFEVYEYKSVKDAQDSILEALAEGVLVEEIIDLDTDNIYSCVWTVLLQNEGKE